MNYVQSGAKSCLPPVFVNRILFTDSHSCRYCLMVVHTGRTAEPQSDHLLCKMKLYSWPLTRTLPTLLTTGYFSMYVFFFN